ncbi:MAG: deoxyribose-phosphate aldolase [Clostridia bacterium]|nr:deoxyribose-phosphate aldolase [Clostridia bacterium]
MKSIEKYIDHTALSPQVQYSDIVKLCREAVQYGFYAVCVNSRFVSTAKKELEGSDVKIACVVGFPLGAMSTESKVFETNDACREGASEIDMVLSVGALKEGLLDIVYEDIRSVVLAASRFGSSVKVILETCLLSDEEIIAACQLSQKAGAAFVKTSTGFSSGGATVHHVELMRKSVGPTMKVKASGGIRDRKTAEEMIAAGADRIGASAGVAICKEVI